MHRTIWTRLTDGIDGADALLGGGLLLLTVGTACEYGWPLGLIVLGGLLSALGVLAVVRRAC